MAQTTETAVPDPELLPDEDHTLVPVEKLVHGEHNPRRVQPKRRLKQSIKGSGINRPLIVRPDPTEDIYHIIDGWQRYQAATDCGWEVLPVKICETLLEAFEETNMASMGRREWTIYDRAQFCWSLYEEMKTDEDSKMAVARKVGNRLDRDPNAIRRYVNVLSLPDVIHPLLNNGPEGTEKQWAMLKNHNSDVRQYSRLRWEVADILATRQSDVSEDRLIAIAARAVAFKDPTDAKEFIKTAVAEEHRRLDMIRREVLTGGDHEKYLIIPRKAVRLPVEEKRAMMDHCHQNRISLSEVVTEAIESLAKQARDDRLEEV
jgi:ParB/RepB/Spo0J family partition protein